MPPKSLICRAATSWPGWSGRPGHSTVATAGWSTSMSATAAAFCAVPLHAQVQRATAPVHEVRSRAGPGTAPAAFWTKRDPLGDGVVVRGHEAADDVAVAAEVLGAGVHDEVGAERERLLEGRRGERVVDRDERTALVGHARRWPRCRRCAAAGWSASRSTPCGCRRRHAGAHRVDVGEVGGLDHQAGGGVDLAGEAEGAAVGVVGQQQAVAGARACAARRPRRRGRRRTPCRGRRLRATATWRSSAERVGLPDRLYSKPLCLPTASWAKVDARLMGGTTAPVWGSGPPAPCTHRVSKSLIGSRLTVSILGAASADGARARRPG